MKANATRPGIAWLSPMIWGFLGIQLTGLTTLVLVAVGELKTSPSEWVCMLALLFGRGFFITAAYHRYFAHRSYQFRFFPRFFQFIFALGGTLAVQKGPLWWASTHRNHHHYTDKPGDPHSPKIDGFLWAHMGWIMAKDKDPGPLKGFQRYPELRLLDRWHIVPAILLALACLVFGGWSNLLLSFFLGTTLLYHTTFSVNSLAHMFGSRRYAVPDTSRNNALVALFALGEGWHNNHHHCQSATFQGERWWELDITGYLLWLLQYVGVTKRLLRRKSSAR